DLRRRLPPEFRQCPALPDPAEAADERAPPGSAGVLRNPGLLSVPRGYDQGLDLQRLRHPVQPDADAHRLPALGFPGQTRRLCPRLLLPLPLRDLLSPLSPGPGHIAPSPARSQTPPPPRPPPRRDVDRRLS